MLVSFPPSTPDQRVNRWMREVYDILNQLPNLSVVSLSALPNASNLSGLAGDLIFNVGSTGSRLYVNVSGTTTSWATLNY